MEENDRQYLLKLARETIAAQLAKQKFPDTGASDSPELKRPCGAFVTLKINNKLRGCIGHIRAEKPLHQTISEMAVAAATQDPRFPPMRPQELDDAHIEISVLTPMERVTDPETIEIGRHGLYIKKGYLSGLLLPQVPVEWKWDRETFLEQTCRKAGLPARAWKDKDTEIYAFTADVFGEEE